MNRNRHLITKLLFVALTVLFVWGAALAAQPPLVPFDGTGDLYVLDNGSKSILRITAAKEVTQAVTTQEITAVTGETDVEFDESGIAFDADGNLYFTDNHSRNVLKKPQGGNVEILVSRQAMIDKLQCETNPMGSTDADPEGLAFGADGNLYVNEGCKDVILKVNPNQQNSFEVLVESHEFWPHPDVSSVSFNAPIVGHEDNVIFVGSSGSPNAIYRINTTDGDWGNQIWAQDRPSGSGFGELNGFMTRNPGGDLIIADPESREIYQVGATQPGQVTMHISSPELRALTTPYTPTLEGGLAFDAGENLYVAETGSQSILRFNSEGEGEVWMNASQLQPPGVTSRPDLQAGIAFAPGDVTATPPPGDGTATPPPGDATATPTPPGDATATPTGEPTATQPSLTITPPISDETPTPTATPTTQATATPTVEPGDPTATPDPGSTHRIYSPVIMSTNQ